MRLIIGEKNKNGTFKYLTSKNKFSNSLETKIDL